LFEKWLQYNEVKIGEKYDMYLKGNQTIEFGEVKPFINVWAMNFFFVFAILTQITNWYQNRVDFEKNNEDF
jgi:hypothetical protein